MLHSATRPYWAIGALIEVNTIFLIAQRNVSGWLQTFCRAGLLISWLPIRIGVPVVLAVGLWENVQAGFVGQHVAPIFVSSIVILSACQIWWTVKLVQTALTQMHARQEL
jgi:hypothetical protein